MKTFFILSALSFAARIAAFPSYASLAGLTQRELDEIIPTFPAQQIPLPPGPLKDNGTKLVNDADHPWMPLQPGDIRGPCPGLNTLASHGWLPRNGIASPSEIVTAAMEGFNMNNKLAIFVTYYIHIVDGNLLTDKLSIGAKSPLTGGDPPPPATVAGMNTHNVFEGDASLTRDDFFFGNNHDLNNTLFEQLVDYSYRFGGGKYNLTVAQELRHQRFQQSIATNPNFSFVAPRFWTAYAEATFPYTFFVDGRKDDAQLDMDAARSFFQHERFPEDFHRAKSPRGESGVVQVFKAYPVQPGRNNGTVNSYTPDPHSADFSTFCRLYENIVNDTIKGLYPDPKGPLRTALNKNLDYFHQSLSFSGSNCTQLFPYGQDQE